MLLEILTYRLTHVCTKKGWGNSTRAPQVRSLNNSIFKIDNWHNYNPVLTLYSINTHNMIELITFMNKCEGLFKTRFLLDGSLCFEHVQTKSLLNFNATDTSWRFVDSTGALLATIKCDQKCFLPTENIGLSKFLFLNWMFLIRTALFFAVCEVV